MFYSCIIKEIYGSIIYGNESSEAYGNWNPQVVLYLELFPDCGEEQIIIHSL